MRIGMSALGLFPGKTGGFETYLINLLKALGEVDKENRYFLLINDQAKDIFPSLPPNFDLVESAAPSFAGKSPVLRRLWEGRVASRAIRQTGLDVIHFPGNFLPPQQLKTKVVLTVHDTWSPSYERFYRKVHSNKGFRNCPSQLRLEDCFPKSSLNRVIRDIILKYSCRKTDAIVTISQFSKGELVNFGVPSDKIAVVHGGTNFSAAPTGEKPEKVLEKYNIQKPYLLTVGFQRITKNLPALLAAYKLMLEKETLPHQLVIVGGGGSAQGAVADVLRKLNLEGRVCLAGFVDAEELPIIYRQAEAFVFPTLYEGFGLPALEAMTYDTPVVCSKIAAVPEVAGEAAVYFDPFDIADISRTIMKVIGDDSLKAELRRKGAEQIKKFTWIKCAKGMVRVFESVVSGRGQ